MHLSGGDGSRRWGQFLPMGMVLAGGDGSRRWGWLSQVRILILKFILSFCDSIVTIKMIVSRHTKEIFW